MAAKIERWDQVIGSKDQIKIILNAIKRKVLPHFVLYTGASGIGKSTVAKLTAKSLLCEQPNPQTGEPCYICASCKAIDAGTHPGYKKINVPEMYKKEDINEQIKNIFKFQKLAQRTVFVLEEIHDLKEDLQRPLLEPLTDIPEDVYIISCTTKPFKLLQELLNRSFRLELLNPSPIECINYTLNVGANYGITMPTPETVEKFVELCEYNPRIISETLQVIATDNTLTEDSLSAMFRTVKDKDVITFIRAIALSDNILDTIEAVKSVEGSSINRLITKSIDIVFNALLFQQTNKPANTFNQQIQTLISVDLRAIHTGTLAQIMAVLGGLDIKDRDSFTKNLSKIIECKLKLMKVMDKSLIGISNKTTAYRQPQQAQPFTAIDDTKDKKDSAITTSEFSNSAVTSNAQLDKLLMGLSE